MIEVFYTKIDTAGLTRGQIRSMERKVGNKLLFFVLKNFHAVKVPPEICVSGSGKPYLADSSYCFSISHRYGRVVLALSDKPIGVDIERSGMPLPDLVKRKLFCGKDATAYDWTRFESYCKLSGSNIYTAVYPPVNEEVFFKSYLSDDDYVISVCSSESCFPEEMFVFDN